MPDQPIPASGRAREAALRAQRRADALRANLRRRKEQARARDAVEAPDADQPRQS